MSRAAVLIPRGRSPASSFDLIFTPEQISAVLGSPVENVLIQWPLVAAALHRRGILNRATAIAAVATIGVEAGGFWPIKEYGDHAYFTRMYEGRSDLGNVVPGDGARYCGRGLIQITGRANYTHYGNVLGVDLAGHPDLALDPNISAEVFAEYFAGRAGGAIPARAEADDWRAVRKLVNGGYNGWDEFIGYVRGLKAIA